HEMAGAAGPTVQIAVLGRAADPLASRQSRRRIPAGRQRGEDRIEMLDHRLVAADHQTIPAFQSPDAAARPAIDVVHAAGSEGSGSSEVVDVVRIAAVDQDVALVEGLPKPV